MAVVAAVAVAVVVEARSGLGAREGGGVGSARQQQRLRHARVAAQVLKLPSHVSPHLHTRCGTS